MPTRSCPKVGVLVIPVPPFDTPSVPVRRLVPMDVVAMTCPDAFVERSELVRLVRYVAPVLVSCVVEAFANCVNAVWVLDALSMYPPVKVWRLLQVLVVVVPKPKEKSPAPLYESGYVAESEEKVGSPNDDVAVSV